MKCRNEGFETDAAALYCYGDSKAYLRAFAFCFVLFDAACIGVRYAHLTIPYVLGVILTTGIIYLIIYLRLKSGFYFAVVDDKLYIRSTSGEHIVRLSEIKHVQGSLVAGIPFALELVQGGTVKLSIGGKSFLEARKWLAQRYNKF